MNGSPQPEDEKDQQCSHCGLYFSNRGIVSHQRNCEFQEWPGALHPEAEEDPDEPALPRDPLTPEAEGGAPSADREPPQPDGVGAEGMPPTGDGPDPAAVETDGGPRPPPEPALEDDGVDDRGEEDVDDEAGGAEPTCPSCGSGDYFDPAELPADVLEELPAEVAAADRACWPCSTTNDGALAPEIEVYDT